MITTLFNKRLKQFAVLATLISIVSSTQAAVALVSLVSNIGNPMGEETYFHTSSPVYQSFTTGSSGANIYEISLSLGFIRSPAIEVSLNADAAGSPGSALSSSSFIYSPGSPVSFQANTFKGSFSVAANTTYWVKVAATGDSSLENYQSITFNTAETGLTGWSIGNSHIYGEGLYTMPGAPILIEIKGTAVPEPSVSCLLGLGLGGLALVRRKARA